MLLIDDISLDLGDFSLKNISFSVEQGEYIVILGMSGVGKTVLLEMLAGILHSDKGRLILENKDITREKIQRRPFGLVYQDQALFPHLSVDRNLAYGLRSQKKPASEITTCVRHIAQELGIDHLLHRFPSTLSGGEAQRVALGRALVTQPRILLLDEPLSALDTQARFTLRRLLKKIHRQGQTIIHVTHDYEEAISLATRIVLMENGAIVQTGNPIDIFNHPKTQFVARFIGIRNVIEGYLTSAADKSTAATFTSKGVKLSVRSDSDDGSGFFMLRSEDIFLSNHPESSPAHNHLQGTIIEIIPASSGAEVLVDIGFEISAQVPAILMEQLDLEIGRPVYIGFETAVGRFMPNEAV